MVNIFRSLALFASVLLMANIIWAVSLIDENRSAVEGIMKLRTIHAELLRIRNQVEPDHATISSLEKQVQKYSQQIRPALHWASIHFIFLIATALISTLVNSITVTYFIGTSRWCKEVVDAYGLKSDLAECSTQLKRKCFPWALTGIVVILLIVSCGGAANPGVRMDAAATWIKGFPAVAMIGALVVVASFWRQTGFLVANYELIQRIVNEVQRVREERGLAGCVEK